MRRILTFLLAAAGLAASAGAQEAPHLLADINRAPHAPYSTDLREEPTDFFNLGDRLLFSTADQDSLDQGILWTTDGTSAGTRQISTTLCVSACGRISPLGVQDGLALLRIDSHSDGVFSLTRLGRTDGTPGGTFLLTGDFLFDGTPLEIFPLPGGAFLFPGCPPGEPCRLWRSDGTRAGTGIFVGMDALPFIAPHAFSLWHGRLYFVALHGEGGEEGLWSTDGTPAGTLFLHAVNDRGDVRAPSAATPSHLFFTSGEAGEDLWSTDGTPAGTRQAADFAPQPCDGGCFLPDVDSLTAVGDRVFFETHRTGHAIEIWESDGTPEGTLPRIELPPQVWSVDSFQRVGGHWLFLAVGFDGLVLWTVDDGFVKATRLRACGGETCPMIYGSISPPGARPFLFAGTDALHGVEPWTTDGTAAGTRRLADICPGTCSGISVAEAPIEVVGPSGTTWFRAFSLGEDLEVDGDELWRTDGTPKGTRAILNLSSSQDILSAIAWRGGLVFAFADFSASESCALWSSDGTAAGTHQLFPAASIFRCPQPLTALGPDFLYAVPKAGRQQGSRLLLSDGTAAGTREIARLGGFVGGPLLLVGGTLFFQVVSDTSTEIWQTDGTAAGTQSTTTLVDPSDLQEFDGSLYLTAALAEDHDAGRALFRLPSSGGPPIQLAKLFQYSEAQLAAPVQFSRLKDQLLFTVQDVERGIELWGTDGTPEGTRRLHRFQPNPDIFSEPAILAGAGDRVIFAASDGVHGWEPWESDGTLEGTRMVADLAPGGFSSMPADSRFAVANGFLFFAADDSKTGLEPWGLPLEPQ